MKWMNVLVLLLSIGAVAFFAGCKEDSNGGGDADTDSDGDSDSDTVDDSETAMDPTHAADDVAVPGTFAQPPGDMDAADVPMFVSIGFDDNAFVDGMEWILDFLADKENADGTPARVTFYNACGYVYDDGQDFTYAEVGGGDDPDAVKAVWKRAYDEGHEIGNHTVNHRQGYAQWEDFNEQDLLSLDEWVYEMQTCNEQLEAIGIPVADIVGFRTPFLGYTDTTMAAAQQVGFAYDCSMEEGWQYDHNGTNYNWPYDLAAGSQIDEIILSWGATGYLRDPVGSHPGLWEMPVHPVVTVPDYRCAEYGIPVGLRSRMKAAGDYFEVVDGKLTGLDYNMMMEFPMTGPEVAATLKYTLDLRRKGNRAPMMWGAHTPYYSAANLDFNPAQIPLEDRRAAVEDFLNYALSLEDVRVVPVRDILEWVKANTPADTDTQDSDTVDSDTADTESDSDTADSDT